MYNQDKYLELLDLPVLGQLFLTATTKTEEGIKELSTIGLQKKKLKKQWPLQREERSKNSN